MEQNIFRQKSIDRISSPEQLQKYMRVTGPRVWMILAAVIALTAGLLICASTGAIETTAAVQVTAEGGVLTAVLPAGTQRAPGIGMPLRAGSVQVSVESVTPNADGSFTVTASADLADGVYDGVIVTDSFSPLRFLIN